MACLYLKISIRRVYFVMLLLQLNIDILDPLPHEHLKGLDLGFDKKGYQALTFFSIIEVIATAAINNTKVTTTNAAP